MYQTNSSLPSLDLRKLDSSSRPQQCALMRTAEWRDPPHFAFAVVLYLAAQTGIVPRSLLQLPLADCCCRIAVRSFDDASSRTEQLRVYKPSCTKLPLLLVVARCCSLLLVFAMYFSCHPVRRRREDLRCCSDCCRLSPFVFRNAHPRAKRRDSLSFCSCLQPLP